MAKPSLVIMAAGMGSRYGGLKQIEPVGPCGEIIMDYSIYDALRAGFEKVVFIITREVEEEFRKVVGNSIDKITDTAYAFQHIGDVPAGFEIPLDRKKPWGTGHAVMSCRDVVDTPFAVINADDFYGPATFRILHDFLMDVESQGNSCQYCLAGFQLENTLTENGHVARGICRVDAAGYLSDIHERTKIQRFADGVKYTEDGNLWIDIPPGSTVSMNTWGFTPSIFKELEERFLPFLEINKENILKAEYFLPMVIGQLVSEHKAGVKVLSSNEQWYGVTYREDKPIVKQAIRELITLGKYPQSLWEGFQ